MVEYLRDSVNVVKHLFAVHKRQIACFKTSGHKVPNQRNNSAYCLTNFKLTAGQTLSFVSNIRLDENTLAPKQR